MRGLKTRPFKTFQNPRWLVLAYPCCATPSTRERHDGVEAGAPGHAHGHASTSAFHFREDGSATFMQVGRSSVSLVHCCQCIFLRARGSTCVEFYYLLADVNCRLTVLTQVSRFFATKLQKSGRHASGVEHATKPELVPFEPRCFILPDQI